VLVVVLSLLLAAGSLPAASLEPQRDRRADGARFYANLGQLFSLEGAGEAIGRGGIPVEGEELTLILRRAVHTSSADEAEWRERGFVFAEEGEAGRFLDLGPDRERALRATGRLVRPARWEEIVRWSGSAGEGRVTSTFRVGRDRVSVTLPRERIEGARAGESAAGGIVLIEANGTSARLDETVLQRARTGRLCGKGRGTSEERALRRIAASFVDLPRFLNHVRGYLEIDRHERVRQALALLPAGEETADSGCATPCLSCAGTLLASVSAYIALVSACGGTLVTGGTTAVLCIAAYLGLQGSHLVVFGSCGRCVECVREPDCPCEGEPLCDCG